MASTGQPSSGSLSPQLLAALDDPDKVTNMARSLHNNACSMADDRDGLRKLCYDTAISMYREALKLRPPSHTKYHVSLHNLGEVLWTQFKQQGQLQILDEVILLFEEALKTQPLLHPDRSTYLNNHATSLCTRYEQTGQKEDLGKAIVLFRQALELRPPSHPRNAASLATLAGALQSRYQYSGDMQDLAEAIHLYKQAVSATSAIKDATRALCLDGLAGLLVIDFKRRGVQHLLDEAIALHREGLKLPSSSSNKATFLSNLAIALRLRFKRSGQHYDIEEALLLHNQSIELCHPPHPDRSVMLNNLANTLKVKFDHDGQQHNLDHAISLHEEALESQPSQNAHRSWDIGNLGNALLTRFERGGQHADLDKAVSLHREALRLQSPSHPDWSVFLSNLGLALRTQFKYNGQQQSLDEAIALDRHVLELELPGNPGRPTSLNNLAVALVDKFHQTGKRRDLDEAISLHRQALGLRLAPHPQRSMSLTNLASSLYWRFHLGVQTEDLREAILLYGQALELRPSSHPDRPVSLNNFALALHTQYTHDGQIQCLDTSITMFQEALQLHSPSADSQQSTILHNLANALESKFERTLQVNDLDEAILSHREALELLPPNHPDQPQRMHSLSHTLWLRFVETDQQGDFDEALSLANTALDHIPLSHPLRCMSFRNLAELFLTAYAKALVSKRDEKQYLEHSMSSFSSSVACTSQSPSIRFGTTKRWSYAADLYEHSSAIEAYAIAINNLFEVASLSLDIRARQKALITSKSEHLTRKAASCAIRIGRYDKAVEFLEAGRAILWSQVLQLRSSFDRLRDASPELSNKLQSISIALEHGTHREMGHGAGLDNSRRMDMEAQASQFTRLSEEWAETLHEVRKIGGFEKFLQPLSISSIQEAAGDYPIVFLVPDDSSSHCLVMTSDIVHYIPLSRKLSAHELHMLVYLTQRAASTSGRSLSEDIFKDRSVLPLEVAEVLEGWVEDRLKGKRVGGPAHLSSDNAFRYVLNTLWTEVVKPVVQLLCLEKSEEPTARVQWCPTGLFTFLPIHAAGSYDVGGDLECTSDYLLSSYTPTTGSLLPMARTTPPRLTDQAGNRTLEVLAIIDPSLPSTQKELNVLSERVSSDCTVVQLGVPNAPAVIASVLSQLPAATIVHFACHGIQDRADPLNSALILKDGMLTISEIMKQPYPNGSLAFLCACETAMGAANLPDEAMSLGASLIFSGFRNVVATMWKVADADGPTVTDIFYQELFRDAAGKTPEKPDFTRAAQALNIAVKQLRTTGVGFHRWIPFIHLGK